MAIRFRKSVKLAPGIRMNFSGSGVSWSLGPRGASIGISKRGTYLNTGIPGTGFYTRERIGGTNTRQNSRSSSTTSVSISVGIADDGTINFKDQSGQALPDRFIRAAKRQHGEAIRNLIQEKCDEINREIESVGELHLLTPSPKQRPVYVERIFDVVKPQPPIPKRLGFFRSLFKSQRDKAEAENQANVTAFDNQLKKWEEQRETFIESERINRDLVEYKIYHDIDAMGLFLEEKLQEISWPRETNVSTEITHEGRVVFIDVDLPELEDMPNKMATVPSKGYKLSVKEMSSTQVQKLYMKHIHGIAFLTIGQAFHALPNAQEIIFSGYSQRPDKSTGHTVDEYLLSVRVIRRVWEKLNFDNLASVDVVEALTNFELRRTMSKTGEFKPILPFVPA
jgi:hypothetical protein